MPLSGAITLQEGKAKKKGPAKKAATGGKLMLERDDDYIQVCASVLDDVECSVALIRCSVRIGRRRVARGRGCR
jgi:hypothetical protein